MNGKSWLFSLLLAASAVLIFVFLMWAAKDTSYCWCIVPSCYVFYVSAFIVAVIAVIIYVYTFSAVQGETEHNGKVIAVYYTAAILGIFLASWFLFEFKPGWNGFIGMALVAIGLVIFVL